MLDTVVTAQGMVQHPSGGVIVVRSDGRYFYYLSSAASKWQQLPMILQTVRLWPTAILIPRPLC